MGTHLKQLLQARHLQTHPAFCREWDRLAKRIDPGLVGHGPSRSTLHRWMTGDVTGLPYPNNCRILEAMFPGWTAEQLLRPAEDGLALHVPPPVVQIVETVRQGLADPEASPAGWRGALQSHGGPGTATLTLPPRLTEPVALQDRDVAHDLGRRLMALQKTLRLSDEELRLVANLSG
jgi:hypothetical protein